MVSIKARKAMLAGAGVIFGFLIAFFVLDIFNFTPDNSAVGVRIGIMAFFVIVGIVAGLMFEKSSRARYLAAMQKNPELQQQIENSYGKSFRFGWIIGALYLLWNVWGVYELFAQGAILSPTAHLQIIIEIIFDGIVILVSLWLFFERGEGATTSNRKKIFLFTAIFFFVSAIISGSALIFLKSTSDSLTNAVMGEGSVVSLGAPATPIGEVSAMLPIGFQLGSMGPNQVVIEPITSSSQAIGSSLITVAVVSSTPEAAIAIVKTNLATQGYPWSESTTTFLGYPAIMISASLDGGQPSNDVALEVNGTTFIIGATETAFPTDAAGQALMISMDNIVSSISIDGTPSLASDSGIITLTTTMPSVTLPWGTNGTTTLSMTVPPEYKLAGGPGGGAIFTVPATSSLGIGLYSISQVGANNAGQQTLINSFDNWTSQDAQASFKATTTTFLGYPAYVITAQNDRAAKTILFQVPGATNFFEIEITYGGPNLTFENSQIDNMVNSIHISTGTTPSISNDAQSVASSPSVARSQSNGLSTKPSITILSPSGGETWQMGQKQTITWSSVGVKNVVIFIHFADGGMCREGIVPASPGEYSFVLTPTCPTIPATLTSGQYTINITDNDPGSNNPDAWSSPFTIAAQN